MDAKMNERIGFINTFGEKAVARYPKEKVLPSLVICQAILESGWGKTGLAVNANNFHGLKWFNDSICRPYKAINYKTQEEYQVGHITNIECAFCLFDDINQELDCYYSWLHRNKEPYRKIHGCTDPVVNFHLIKEGGYATDSGYVSKLERIYNQYIAYIKPFDDRCLGIKEQGEKPMKTKMYKVQVGAYTIRGNAEFMAKRLQEAGFPCFIKEEEVETEAPKAPSKPMTKTNEQIADEVIQGKWGNGAVRKQRLESAGYNYNEVQAMVNQLLG